MPGDMSLMPPGARLLALVVPAVLTFSAPAFAAERALVREQAERKEVRHSMVGPRSTLLFYTFAKQQAVLKLLIDNKDDSFPVTGNLYLFDPKTTAEGLAKWLNNQHSDGLFPEVPEPVEVVDLPDGICTVAEPKLAGEVANEGPFPGTFADYKVKVLVKGHQVAEKFDLKAFEDQAGVFVKVTKG